MLWALASEAESSEILTTSTLGQRNPQGNSGIVGTKTPAHRANMLSS
jgi:hypothetical protein